MMRRDKYGRGSAAANGEGFVDLAPGDTFAALEAQLKRRIAERFDNLALGISASIGSKRNASELAKHLASGEEEEAHKFAAKNIGVLFARGKLGVSHDDKKAVAGQRWITRFIRVFAPFRFAGNVYLATLTLKDVDPEKKIYAVEAVEINQDAKSRSTPRGAMSRDLNSAPFQDLTSQLKDIVAYYIGDVNRTHPKFVGRTESFTVDRTVDLLVNLMSSVTNHQPPITTPQPQITSNQPPTFSIIIPVYNVAPYLRECLDSVLAQTFADWEVICVDDGSTDGSGAILDEYAAKDSRFRVFHQRNAGVSFARNVGLDAARGGWVWFVDADDAIHSCALDCVSKAIHGTDAQQIAIREIGSDKITVGDFMKIPVAMTASRASDPHLVDSMTMTRLRRAGWAVLHKRSAIGDVRFRPYSIGEDVLFTFEVFWNSGRKALMTDATLYFYRMRGGSLVNGSVTLRKVQDCIETEKRCMRLILENRTHWTKESLHDFLVRNVRFDFRTFNWLLLRLSHGDRRKCLLGWLELQRLTGELYRHCFLYRVCEALIGLFPSGFLSYHLISKCEGVLRRVDQMKPKGRNCYE